MSAIGYVTNQDGSYTFEMEDGRKVTAAGPVAAQTALDLDNRMVGKTGGLWNEIKRGFGALGGVRQTSTPEQEGIREAAKEAKQPEAQPPVQPPPQGVPGARPIPTAAPPPQPRIFVQKGGEMLGGRTTQHGPGLTPEQQNDLAEMTLDKRLALQELEDAERGAQQGREAMAGMDVAHRIAQAEEIAKENQQHTEREEAALEEQRKADEAAANYIVDPGRFWSSRNGWQKGVALLGGVLGGAFAARSSSGRNHFGERLEKLVEDDIKLQENELASLERMARAKKDYLAATQIANERAKLRSGEQRVHMLETIGAYARQMEENTKSPLIAARAKLVQIDIQESLAREFISEDQNRRGTETRQYVNVPDRAVVIGGSQAGTDYEPEGKDLEKSVNDYVKQSESIAEARAAASSLTKALELEPEDASGLGYVAGEMPGFMVGKRGRANRQLVEDYIATTARAMFGANMTEQEFERHRKRVIGNGSEEHLRRSVAEVNKQVQERERHIESGYHPRVIELAKRRGATAARPIHPSAREGASQ